LSGQEHSGLVQKEIEEMRRKHFGIGRVELLDKLVEEVKCLHPLRKHLLLDLIEDLVRFVFPIHAVTKIINKIKPIYLLSTQTFYFYGKIKP
jgi:hypothetical protein